MSTLSHRGKKSYKNHGREWTSREMDMITDPNRPSDEVLSLKLKRSVQAIQAMRYKAG